MRLKTQASHLTPEFALVCPVATLNHSTCMSFDLVVHLDKTARLWDAVTDEYDGSTSSSSTTMTTVAAINGSLFRLFVWLFVNLVMREQTLLLYFTSRFVFLQLTFGRMPTLTRRSRASTFQIVSARLSNSLPCLASKFRNLNFGTILFSPLFQFFDNLVSIYSDESPRRTIPIRS